MKFILTILALLTISCLAFCQPYTVQWAYAMGNAATYPTVINTSVVDGDGSLYLSAQYDASLDIDFTGGVLDIISPLFFGYGPMFMCKYHETGYPLWYQNPAPIFEADAGAYTAKAMDIDASGNVLVGCTFQKDISMGGYGVTGGDGTPDIFLVKMNSSGAASWAGKIGASGTEQIEAVAFDNSGNMFASGVASSACDLDPGTGVVMGSGGFLLKLNSAGATQWVHYFGSTLNVYAMETDASGAVIIAGRMFGIIDFDPGPGTHLISTSGILYAGIVAKYNADGTFAWASPIHGLEYGGSNDIVVDVDGNIITAGSARGTIDFDPGPGTFGYTAFLDVAYVQKLDAAGNLLWAKWTEGTSGCFAYSLMLTPDGRDVISVGTFVGAVDFDPSAANYTMTAMSPNVESFLWHLDTDGNLVTAAEIEGMYVEARQINMDDDHNIYVTGTTYAAADFDPGPGTYNVADPNTSFVEDVFVCKYTYCFPTYAVISDSTCGLYTSPSGSHVWSAAGTYQDTLTNAAGCDSIITVHLTIPDPDETVAYAPPTLTSNQVGATYQWLDCATGAPIAGETGISFTATVTGSYAVAVNLGGCVDTSACIPLVIVSTLPSMAERDIKVYPNPTSGQLSVVLPAFCEYHITLENGLGQALSHLNGAGADASMQIGGPAGFYFVRVRIADREEVFKVIKGI